MHTEKISKIKKYALMSLMLAAGIVLQWVDGFLSIGVPGGKLGLANVVSVLNLYLFGAKNALFVAVLRAFLGSVLGGGISSVPYSVCGAVSSVLVMAAAKKYFSAYLSEIGISVCGACVHNLAQIAVACVVFENASVASYGSVLILVGTASGALTGITAAELNKKLFRYKID